MAGVADGFFTTPTANGDAAQLSFARPLVLVYLKRPPVPAVAESAPTYIVNAELKASCPIAATVASEKALET